IKNKGWRFLTTLVLASLFHASSVLFSLMLVFIYKFRGLKVKHSLIVYFITSFFFVTQLSDNLVNLISFDVSYLDTYSSTEIIQHYGGSYNINFYLFNTGFLLFFVFL